MFLGIALQDSFQDSFFSFYFKNNLVGTIITQSHKITSTMMSQEITHYYLPRKIVQKSLCCATFLNRDFISKWFEQKSLENALSGLNKLDALASLGGKIRREIAFKNRTKRKLSKIKLFTRKMWRAGKPIFLRNFSWLKKCEKKRKWKKAASSLREN